MKYKVGQHVEINYKQLIFFTYPLNWAGTFLKINIVDLLATPSPVLVPVRCLRRVKILNLGTFIYFVSPVEPDRRALTSQYYGLKDQPLNSHREPKYPQKHEIHENQPKSRGRGSDFR